MKSSDNSLLTTTDDQVSHNYLIVEKYEGIFTQ